MAESDEIKFMQEAIRLSVANVEEGKGGPFGAIVVKDGKITDSVSVAAILKLKLLLLEKEITI